jgi:hypothetical protein
MADRSIGPLAVVDAGPIAGTLNRVWQNADAARACGAMSAAAEETKGDQP